MSNTSLPFRDTMFYPIVFMVILSLVFVGILAVQYRLSESRIETYKQESYQKLVLSLCAASIARATGVTSEQILSNFSESYEKYIRPSSLKGEDRPSFSVSLGDSVIVRCVDIPGKGLWGSMRGLVALSPDLTEIRDFAIYEQMETPGLGARITEEWFQAQFRYRQVISDGKFLALELIPEKQAADAAQINQVTGATITSSAVIKMLSSELQTLYEKNQAGDQR